MMNLLLFFVVLCCLCSLTHSTYTQVVVAQDGLGDFAPIMEAVNAVPESSLNRFVIKIEAGVYDEMVTVGKKKWNVVFVGDGVETTIVTGNRSSTGGFRTFESATLAIEGDGFLATGITIQNNVGPEAGQAVAVRVSSYRVAFYKCRIASFQDTLYTQDEVQFFRECEIYGTIDFIFGHARVVFQHCSIFGRLPAQGQVITITAQNRDPTSLSGIVIHDCIISATRELIDSVYPVKAYLGRPWSDYSTTVIMESYLDRFIDLVGWLDWNNRSSLDTIVYVEYSNEGPGADTSGRVTWIGLEVLHNSSGVALFTVRQFIDGASWICSTGIPHDLDFRSVTLTNIGVHLTRSDWILTTFLYVIFIVYVMH